jgi:hypothetical protein
MSDLDTELKQLERDYPRWHTWRGVAGLLYARRPRSSPPAVVRSASVTGLRRAIETWTPFRTGD